MFRQLIQASNPQDPDEYLNDSPVSLQFIDDFLVPVPRFGAFTAVDYQSSFLRAARTSLPVSSPHSFDIFESAFFYIPPRESFGIAPFPSVPRTSAPRVQREPLQSHPLYPAQRAQQLLVPQDLVSIVESVAALPAVIQDSHASLCVCVHTDSIGHAWPRQFAKSKERAEKSAFSRLRQSIAHTAQLRRAAVRAQRTRLVVERTRFLRVLRFFIIRLLKRCHLSKLTYG